MKESRFRPFGFVVLLALVSAGSGFMRRHVRSNETSVPNASARAAEDRAPCRIAESVQLPEGVNESSGVAISRRSPDLLWTHNDSGDPEVIAVDAHGSIRGRVRVTGATLEDWEDIASGSCGDGSCLYIADIGDNEAARPSITLYRVPEPDPTASATAPAEAFHATYPDGPQDAEAVFILPDGAVYLASKGETGPAGLYRFPQPLRPGATVTLEKIASISSDAMEKSRRITGASASPDGRWIALRTLHSLSLYPARAAVAGRLSDPVVMDLAALQEAQGEGIALSDAGTVFLTSEAGGKKEPAMLSRLACTLPR